MSKDVNRGLNYFKNCKCTQCVEYFKTEECKPACVICNQEVKNNYLIFNNCILCHDCDNNGIVWAAKQAYKEEQDKKETEKFLEINYLKKEGFISTEEETVLYDNPNAPKPKGTINFPIQESERIHYYIQCLNQSNGKHLTININKITCKECRRQFEKEELLRLKTKNNVDVWHYRKSTASPLCNPINQNGFVTERIKYVTCKQCFQLYKLQKDQELEDSKPEPNQNENIEPKTTFREFL